MKQNLEGRLAKLETALTPPPLPSIRLKIFGNQCGTKGQAIMQETNEEAIARHLAEHPEDTGREFDFTHVSFIHGKWNEQGQFMCDEPACAHFQKPASTI